MKTYQVRVMAREASSPGEYILHTVKANSKREARKLTRHAWREPIPRTNHEGQVTLDAAGCPIMIPGNWTKPGPYPQDKYIVGQTRELA